jgi:hypothetical protein
MVEEKRDDEARDPFKMLLKEAFVQPLHDRGTK